jgi:hypothetical protein
MRQGYRLQGRRWVQLVRRVFEAVIEAVLECGYAAAAASTANGTTTATSESGRWETTPGRQEEELRKGSKEGEVDDEVSNFEDEVCDGGEMEGAGAEAEAERGLDVGGEGGEEEILAVSSSPSQERISPSRRDPAACSRAGTASSRCIHCSSASA